MRSESTSVYILLNWPLVCANVKLGHIVVTPCTCVRRQLVVFHSTTLIGSKHFSGHRCAPVGEAGLDLDQRNKKLLSARVLRVPAYTRHPDPMKLATSEASFRSDKCRFKYRAKAAAWLG